MHVELHPKFEKALEKLRPTVQVAAAERLRLFSFEPHNRILNTHRLKGEYAGYWSINITGDMRAIYFLQEAQLAVFVKIGTHSKLYKE